MDPEEQHPKLASCLLKDGHTYIHLNIFSYVSPTISSNIYPKLLNYMNICMSVGVKENSQQIG